MGLADGLRELQCIGAAQHGREIDEGACVDESPEWGTYTTIIFPS